MKEFELKEEHLKLIKYLCWNWEDCEFGAPAVNCKRPFGNSSVYLDIAEILDEEFSVCPHCGEIIKELDQERYLDLYNGLEFALRIICQTQSFELGSYTFDDIEYKWKKVNNK